MAEAPHPADRRAVLCSAAGTFAPSGDYIGPALDSVERLARMLTWAADQGRLCTEGGTLPQVWIVGPSAVEPLGWLVDPGETDDTPGAPPLDVLRDECRARLTEAVRESLPILERGGWRARSGWETGGAWVRLERYRRRDDRPRGRGAPAPRAERVDVILEPFAWTTPAPTGAENLGVLGDDVTVPALPEDEDAARAELGQRLCWCVDKLTVLPGTTAARTGALVVSSQWRDAKKRNDDIAARGLRSAPSALLTEPVAVPPLSHPPRGDIEPASLWAVSRVDPAEVAAAATLGVLDQRASFLASLDMVGIPRGLPRQLTENDDLDSALWWSEAPPSAWPQGLWTAMFPTAAAVPGWDHMPPVHPDWWHQATTAPEVGPIVTVTTETLRALAAEPVNARGNPTGGLGLDWCREHIALIEGWVYPESCHPYKAFQKRLGDAYKGALAEGDVFGRRFAGAVYKGYIGAMNNDPGRWGEHRAAHSQPVGRAGVVAHARWRVRRKAAEIHQRHGLWPIAQTSDALTYLLPESLPLAALGDRDDDGAHTLGRMIPERSTPLTDAARARLVAAETPARVHAAIAAAFAPGQE